MIGVFGGTFDPVHFGHLRPALEVFEALQLRQMRFIPAGQPPHREPPQAEPRQRESLLLAALGKDTPGLVVDNRELRRPGPSYMVETLESLRHDLKDEAICLVLGMDAFLQLESWHRWEDITELAHLVVTHRPGWEFDPERMPSGLVALWRRARVDDPALLNASPAGGLYRIAVTQLDISASRVRDCIAAGGSPRFLVPDAVWNLIRLQCLYGYTPVAMNLATDKQDETCE